MRSLCTSIEGEGRNPHYIGARLPIPVEVKSYSRAHDWVVGRAGAIVAKLRNGPIGIAGHVFNSHLTEFTSRVPSHRP